MNRAGFTLLEFILVLAVLGIVLALSIGFLVNYQRLEAFRGAVSQLVADLNETRAQSRKTALNWRLERISTTKYSYGYGTLSGTPPSFVFTSKKDGILPNGATFDTTAAFNSSVTYNTPYGNVNSANTTIRLFRTSPNLAARINIVGVTGKLVPVYE